MTQLSGKLGITPGYMRKIPNDLAAKNFNTFIENAQGTVQLAVEGDAVTAVLKEKTLPIEPIDVIEEMESRHNEYEVGTWFYDDFGFTIRALGVSIPTFEPRVGDIVRAGADLQILENTDLSISARGVMHRLICTNGATAVVPAELKRAIARASWREPLSRMQLAMAAMDDAMDRVIAIGKGLDRMTTMELDLPTDPDDRFTCLKSGMRELKPKRITNKDLVASIDDELRREEPTMYGLYNTLTRIGRDSRASDRRLTFENAGLGLAVEPELVFTAIHEMADTLSV
jgi:hypothetical protein